jgi:hypothetical protein
MNRNLITWQTVLVCVTAALVMAGCASQQAKSTESVLAAAGFDVRYADTPDKLTHLEQLTQRKLVEHSRDGKPAYVYADAKGCKCLYAGDEKDYQQYQKLAMKEQLANEQVMAAEMNQDADMNWGLWWGD